MSSNGDKSHSEMTGRVMLVSAATFLSRVIGFLRDAVFAHFWGTGLAMAAWVFAFRIPNLFRALFGEGALTAAFIPLFNRKFEKEGRESSWAFACNILSVTATFLTLITALLVLVSFALRLFCSSDLSLLILKLLPWVLPFIVLICLTALLSGVLHSLNHFLAPSLMPVMLNVVMIGSALYICPAFGASGEQQIMGLAFGVLIAGIAQVLILYAVLRKKGYHFRFRPKVTSETREVGGLAVPALVGAGVYQINVMVDTLLAGWLGAYALTSLHYSQRLVYFPVGIFAVALGVVCLPLMSRAVAAKQIDEVVGALQFSLKMVLFLTLPVTLLFAMFGEHVIRLAFERGSFSAESTADTLYALCFYLPGIPAFSAVKVIIPAYHSRLDTKTPLKISLFCLGLNLIMNLVLMQFFKQGGLALATSLSSFLNIVLLLYFLRREIGCLQLRSSLIDVGRLVLCLIPMLAVGLACNKFVITSDVCSWNLLFQLTMAVALAGAAYLIAAFVLKCDQPRMLLAKLSRRG